MKKYSGKSTDIKPKDAEYGDSFYETDTGKLYYKNHNIKDNNGWFIPSLKTINKFDKLYLGDITTDPTALLHLKAGTAVAGTAPIKMTAGINTTVVVDGQIEFDGINYFVTSDGIRYILTKTIVGSAVPTITPSSIGIQFIDTVTKKIYVSTGIVSSADWTILN